MTKKKKTEHVIHRMPDTLACLHCGQSYAFALPAPIDIVTGIFEMFGKQHKGCKLGARGLACSYCFDFGHVTDACPRTEYGGDWRKWALGPDTGTSSKTIARKLAGASAFDYAELDGSGFPYDPDDFGRCHRLLHAIPGWRARIGEMKGVPGWAKLVAHWDELEALYLEELPSGNAPKLYKRMQELRER